MPNSGMLAELADRMAISDLIYRYTRAMDRNDVVLGYSIWHANSIADFGQSYQGDGPGFVDFACASHQNLLAHQHFIGIIIIDLDGEEAGSEAYFHANMQAPAEGAIRHLAVWGRYLDRWERREGRWGIIKRVTAIDFDEIRDSVNMGGKCNSTRDRNDPSYAVLGSYGSQSDVQDAGKGDGM